MEEKPTAAFILSLIGGMLILLPGLFVTIAFNSYGLYEGEHMMGWHMMGWNMMWFSTLAGFIGLASGIMIIIGSLMLYSRPKEATVWGTIIVAFSVISLVGMGGFFVGFVLGLIGGILALTWKPQHG